jgi:hypothetical protein
VLSPVIPQNWRDKRGRQRTSLSWLSRNQTHPKASNNNANKLTSAGDILKGHLIFMLLLICVKIVIDLLSTNLTRLANYVLKFFLVFSIIYFFNYLAKFLTTNTWSLLMSSFMWSVFRSINLVNCSYNFP